MDEQEQGEPIDDVKAAVAEIMEQAQVFASAWSLVGKRFDGGSAMDDAEEAKLELRVMVAFLANAATTPQPKQEQGEPVVSYERFMGVEKELADMTAEFMRVAKELAEAKQEQRSDRASADSEQLGEPVAWVNVTDEGKWYVQYTLPKELMPEGTKFYTTPQQRTWVGLTTDDWDEIKKQVSYNFEMTTGEYAERISHLVEDRLQEKNT
jgi:hypothetical protein